MVKAGKTMWKETVKANCSRASISASKSSMALRSPFRTRAGAPFSRRRLRSCLGSRRTQSPDVQSLVLGRLGSRVVGGPWGNEDFGLAGLADADRLRLGAPGGDGLRHRLGSRGLLVSQPCGSRSRGAVGGGDGPLRRHPDALAQIVLRLVMRRGAGRSGWRGLARR